MSLPDQQGVKDMCAKLQKTSKVLTKLPVLVKDTLENFENWLSEVKTHTKGGKDHNKA